MIGVEYNQGTQRFNYLSSQNKVITCSNHNLNETEILFKYGTSNDQFLDTQNDDSSFSDNSIYEVSHAAETLVKMAHDTFNIPNNYSDFRTLFGFQDQRYLRVSEEIKGNARIDHCGILSNSLCAVTGIKNGLEDALTYDHYYLPALDYDGDVAMKRRKCEMGSFDLFSNVPQNDVHANYDANVQLSGCTLSNMMLNCKCDKTRGDLISPTNQKRLGFSIIHLISAVRLALVAPTCNGSLSYVNNITGSDSMEEVYLSVDEIVEQVRLRPGDSRILQSKVHLTDLIRGALRIFSSETSPFEADFWNPLAVYDKSRKGWAWIGPVPCLLLESLDSIDASCTPKFWGLPRDVLVKLVDCFADWLRANMNVLKQRASLPPPPLAFTLFKVNSKERFLGRQTSKGCHPTIKPSIGDIRAYFRAEERIRYMTPDRAYAYTSADGRKSSVAPVKKCGEKQSKRTQTHFLRGDRPSSITILTIVRDAAARLPGRIGTRGDVAVLVRDSQYLLDGISDEQMSHVVSGGLDRLHYERDPCVRFDKQRRLWVYLHGDREEEDFDDDGRQSRVTRWKIKDKQYSRIEV